MHLQDFNAVLAQLYNVLVVGAQYRLGVFGFLALEELQDAEVGSSSTSTGNYGTLDQRAALSWLGNHANSFGGDPAHSFLWGGWADGARGGGDTPTSYDWWL